ncbi:MAG TPA: FxLYD domain-containing protein, partial [Verrucomicrobiae bacterium]
TAAPLTLTNGFSVSKTVIEKTSGSSLAYASGSLKNDTDKQRFGVTVELELMDSKGGKIGTAKDYAAIIEPNMEWKFRALLVQKNVAAARVANVKEQE